jgi:hypothetical protein
MTWIFNNTAGRLILMALFHWSFDAVPEALRFSRPGTDPLVFALLAGSLWLLAAVDLWLTRGSLGYTGTLMEHGGMLTRQRRAISAAAQHAEEPIEEAQHPYRV